MASSTDETKISIRSKSSFKSNGIDLESMRKISSQFFEMVPVRRMKWKDDDAAMLTACPDLQIQLLNATVRHPVCKNFPPALAYRRYFMKLLIQKLEAGEADVADEVYEAYTDLLSYPDDDDETVCFKSYSLPSGEYISLQESVHLVSQGTTGLSTWQVRHFVLCSLKC
ncbi:protein-lysine N-methyltransferase EEF2KMT [Elysia marginata]|uniref:Protein-lysine N-methyltransferase EEF2KMT n=1 Tax=Elysia marginata TaxID=1093978 RepID=A0AAV4JGX7_9GAST|nr:protein-lysine N-methyltransferase EEF2KMT [Elysia marginata]